MRSAATPTKVTVALLLQLMFQPAQSSLYLLMLPRVSVDSREWMAATVRCLARLMFVHRVLFLHTLVRFLSFLGMQASSCPQPPMSTGKLLQNVDSEMNVT
jgi:cell division inhibitor SulA